MSKGTIPRRIWDAINSRAFHLSFFDDVPDAAARRQAIAEIAAAEKLKVSALRKSTPPPPPTHRRAINSATYQDALDVYNMLMRPLVQSVAKTFKPTSTSSTHPTSPVTTGGHQNVRRVRRSKPSPPPEEPPAPPRRDLLYAVGLTGGIGVRSGAININHEFSDSPATQTWRQQNGRV